MTVHTGYIEVKTKGENDILDITEKVAEMIDLSGIGDGIACVFVSGSTGAITTLEYEPGLLKDLPDALEQMMPKDKVYEHHLRWQDGNGHSHVRAAILGPSVSIPIISGKLALGTWQQIVFIELDARGRERELIVQIVGE
ncbi:MAG: secondary thiamine-phosphate synthase enzyme YjbQ [Thermoplasmata archaeon]|nr:secondary thiamine-phosphate synthase enzyme YjbQ [Thermoplasmata archaeon]